MNIIEDKIETARKALHNALKRKDNEEKILEISREMDKYIIEYYKEDKSKKY
ncbi:MAG: Spo0E family sporulation regulatory protein-aspartic acid phosphatase [Tepidanaerobacter acetatoxydans]|jgi:uncharacterized protein YfeS|uniref:aspartyl-phosphate phosphatase Spo0E family protein n=1 Tax=Tepidanaerobacter acetatoxydans TaxID=499229 RepID=UPI0026F2C6FC|nr:aspartyl-phosphate phosphatase Spo0E family protein [Tepidanaerobacter acetatoxydans]NLU10784.1 Spo0E family sporulation regulatory protein-aspartic acid phosphatase [Tepidanaerobacter acetatoxydans]